MKKEKELGELLRQIDEENHTREKLERLNNWLSGYGEVQSFRILYFTECSGESSSNILYRQPTIEADHFPDEPALLNGHSAVPRAIFPQKLRESVTVYVPIHGRGGTKQGALLLKSDNASQFMQKYEALLKIIASKVGDICGTAELRYRLHEACYGEQRSIEGEGVQQSSVIPQEYVGRLMDTLGLPMYITNRRGEFVKVNERFLRAFGFSELEELNGGEPFFLENETWSAGLREIVSGDSSGGVTMHVRGADGTVRVVKDSAALIGLYTLGVLFDISSYARWNEELQLKVEELRRLNEKLSATSAILQKTQTTTMKSLAKLAEYRDMETGNHLHRICEYNRLLSGRVRTLQPYSFDIAEEYVQDIYLSGMLHDIGKVGVPDQILLKPGSLNNEEWEVMKKHTIWGWDLLKEADEELGQQSFLTLASRIALSHHERYDGAGYPKKLRGEDIPLSARISAISDVYDALTSARPYKEAWPHERAVEEIVRQRGAQFDPVLVDILQDLEYEFYKIKLELPDSSMVN